MKDLLVEQIVLLYTEDPVTAAKVSVDFAKNNENLRIVGGAMGNKALDSKGIVEVSKMPSREEILSTISSILTNPGSSLGAQISGPASNISSVLAGIGEKRQ